MKPILVATMAPARRSRARGGGGRPRGRAGKLDLYLWILRVMDGLSEDVAQFTATERSPIGDAL